MDQIVKDQTNEVQLPKIEDIQKLTDSYHIRLIREVQDRICNGIKEAAYSGLNYYTFNFELDLKSGLNLESITYIYNWILKANYKVEDNSRRKYFIIRW